jgi:hypothetical protein
MLLDFMRKRQTNLIFELRFLLGMVADGFYGLWPTKCQQEFETE